MAAVGFKSYITSLISNPSGFQKGLLRQFFVNENFFRMCFVNASISFVHLWFNLVAPCPSILTNILLFPFSLFCVTTPEYNWYWFTSHQVSIIHMVIFLMCIFIWITQMKKSKTSYTLKNIDYYKKSSQIMNINDRCFFYHWSRSIFVKYMHDWSVILRPVSTRCTYISHVCVEFRPVQAVSMWPSINVIYIIIRQLQCRRLCLYRADEVWYLSR